MEELTEILRMHAQKYPMMKPQDCVKLIYQNEFGPEHALGDIASVQQMIEEEMNTAESGDTELFTEIGSGLVRVDLYQARGKIPAEVLAECFVRTANMYKGSLSALLRKLKYLSANAGKLGFAYDEQELKEYLSFHRSNAYPAVHHTPQYREAYHPHYRVIRRDMLEGYFDDREALC